MKKNFVLDTNVLIYDPMSVFNFQDNDVFIPIYCIEELDKFKHEASSRGRNARKVSRLLDDMRKDRGSLSDGVSLNFGGRLTITVPVRRPQLPVAIDLSMMDHAILQTALDIRDRDATCSTVFVTMDTNLRIRADALGMVSETYESAEVDSSSISNIKTIYVSETELLPFSKGIAIKLYNKAHKDNEHFILVNGVNLSQTMLGRYDAASGFMKPLHVPKDGILGIRPKNVEQWCALDLLLDDSISLVTLTGNAGTGKTLLALAAGIHKSINDSKYNRLLVSRPIMPLGKDIGFLPGTIEEKMNPWMQPIFDNLEFIFADRKGVGSYESLLKNGQMQVEPLTYIRGRTLPKQFMIVDECQNLTPHEVKTIISRAGDGTKIVLTGDPCQIDNPYIDNATNGLSVVMDRFRGESVAGHVTLTKGERSKLADLATRLM